MTRRSLFGVVLAWIGVRLGMQKHVLPLEPGQFRMPLKTRPGGFYAMVHPYQRPNRMDFIDPSKFSPQDWQRFFPDGPPEIEMSQRELLDDYPNVDSPSD